jgi:uncharacterized protein DUF397
MSWRKSSRSNTGQCVEVRHDLSAVRDSKRPGPELVAPVGALVQGLKDGYIGRP